MHEKLKEAINGLCLADELAESELDAIAEAAIQDDGRLARAVNDALERATVAIERIKRGMPVAPMTAMALDDERRFWMWNRAVDEAAAVVRGMKEELQ